MARQAITTPSAEVFREYLKYDPDAGVLTWTDKNKKKANKPIKGMHENWYITFSFQGKTYKAHRVAWLLYHGEWPPHQIDHINGNRGDNRIVNLRSVTQFQNMKNARLNSNNTSGVCGVYWVNNKWLAAIGVNNKLIRLGSFDCKIDAYAARLRAEKKYGFHKNHGRIAD